MECSPLSTLPSNDGLVDGDLSDNNSSPLSTASSSEVMIDMDMTVGRACRGLGAQPGVMGCCNCCADLEIDKALTQKHDDEVFLPSRFVSIYKNNN